MKRSQSARISPTAHYTGYVWTRRGLSVPELETRPGRLMYRALLPADSLLRLAGRANLEDVLLTRHRVIDHELERAIEDGRVGQVVEVAAGLSPRGLRIARRHRRCRYIEADLEGMAARKRRRLDRIAHRPDNLEVRVVDALATGGEGSLAALASELDATTGVCVITEGLVNYFDADTVRAIWKNIAAFLGGFPYGLYLSDIHLEGDARRVLGVRLFTRALSIFARGAVHLPFVGPKEVRQALLDSGFASGSAALAADFAGADDLASAQESGYVRIVRAEAVCKTPDKG